MVRLKAINLYPIHDDLSYRTHVLHEVKHNTTIGNTLIYLELFIPRSEDSWKSDTRDLEGSLNEDNSYDQNSSCRVCSNDEPCGLRRRARQGDRGSRSCPEQSPAQDAHAYAQDAYAQDAHAQADAPHAQANGSADGRSD
jgi:hypothetical protein